MSCWDPMTGTYTAPNIPTSQITGEIVRDELLRCFESANKEFFTLLNQPVTDEALKTQVKQFVEGVFQSCGVSYTEPTKTGILTAISQCKSNAEKMMGPKGADIINHHYTEMMKLVDRHPENVLPPPNSSLKNPFHCPEELVSKYCSAASACCRADTRN